jgi:hypothetical protein
VAEHTLAAAVAEHTSAAAVAEHTLAAAGTSAELTSVVAGHASAADKLGLVASRPGAGEAHPPWLGVDPDRVSVRCQDSGLALSPPVDTVAISGTAVGGTTALARAGYGQTITASTCGPAIKVRDAAFT